MNLFFKIKKLDKAKTDDVDGKKVGIKLNKVDVFSCCNLKNE